MNEVALSRVRYRAPTEKPLLIAAGPVFVVAVAGLGAWSRWVEELSFGKWVTAELLSLLFPVALLALLAQIIELGFGDPEEKAWRRSLAATGGGFLGSVILVGAWGKLLDPVSFGRTIEAEGLDRVLAASTVVLIAVGLEVGLGSALVFGARKLLILLLSTGLVGFFLFLTGRAFWRFRQGIVVDSESCGCFGNLMDRTPDEAFVQDCLLLVPGLLLAFLGVVSVSIWRRVLLALLLALAGVGLAHQAPDLPLDDLATRLRPGTELAEVCTGRGEERLCLPTLIPEVTEGRHLVVLADLEDPVFGEAVHALNRHWLGGNDPRLWVLSSATPEQSRTFFWQYGPSFEIHEAPPGLLRPLYRALPRSFLVTDGTVVETFSGLPPLPQPGQ